MASLSAMGFHRSALTHGSLRLVNAAGEPHAQHGSGRSASSSISGGRGLSVAGDKRDPSTGQSCGCSRRTGPVPDTYQVVGAAHRGVFDVLMAPITGFYNQTAGIERVMLRLAAGATGLTRQTFPAWHRRDRTARGTVARRGACRLWAPRCIAIECVLRRVDRVSSWT